MIMVAMVFMVVSQGDSSGGGRDGGSAPHVLETQHKTNRAVF